ncbi:unnamed protein product [Pseudo-nitzschia multistriata]|uniref:EamA domain-containing protein n=1 Tax=Pseudo-nitzschia multistriata TaxID=183589 RepID=A0A448ZBJ4_9STRA|nr:unnamed protein product [Pseudo-nitzschia multistriata]
MDNNYTHEEDASPAVAGMMMAQDVDTCVSTGGHGDENSKSIPSTSATMYSKCKSPYSTSEFFFRLWENRWILLLGQVLSLLLASGGAAQATLHLQCGLSAPTFAMSLVYLGLFAIHCPLLWFRRWRESKSDGLSTVESEEEVVVFDQHAYSNSNVDANGHAIASYCRPERSEERLPITVEHGEKDAVHPIHSQTTNDNISSMRVSKPLLKKTYFWYLLLAFCDTQANALTILAFRYTTLTSVTLFDSLAIPSAMILSSLFFQSTRRYQALHYLGVFLCMVGVVFNVLQDYKSDNEIIETTDSSSYTHKLRGDVCAIVGGLLYGLNDVLTEVTLSETRDTTEYLGMIGACGSIIAILQAFVLERVEIQGFLSETVGISVDGDELRACSTAEAMWLLVAFVGVTICSYLGASRFLMVSEAALFNLSLLTGDLWSVVFSVFGEKIVPRPLFFCALAAVLSGVVVYEMAPSPALEKRHGGKHSNNIVKECTEGTPIRKDGIFRETTDGGDAEVISSDSLEECGGDSNTLEIELKGIVS